MIEGGSTPQAGTSLGTPLARFAAAASHAEFLPRLGLRTVGDVLFYFPRRYEPRAPKATIATLDPTREQSIGATIVEIESRVTTTGKHMLGVLFKDDTGFARAVWFNQAFLQQKLAKGQQWIVTGKPRLQGLRWEFVHPALAPRELDPALPESGGLLPVYRTTKGLKPSAIRRLARGIATRYAQLVPEILPGELRSELGLPGIAETLTQMHAPESLARLEQARHRLVFQEFLVQQLALAMRRNALDRHETAIPLPCSAVLDARIRNRFSFRFTAAQDAAIAEITRDLGRTTPMNRLLHGDVGSGKTAVAIYAMLVATAARTQSALLVPTEVLARQHYDTLRRALHDARVRIGLWTGAVGTAERQTLRDEIEAGEIDLLIGTQALFHAQLRFPRLGLVVVDEQHRFGVRQRGTLRAVSASAEGGSTESAVETPPATLAHQLVMTATPIPRTMAMLMYGDLDVSTLRETPPGRQTTHTYHVPEERREAWWDFIRRQLRTGRQGYVIVPRVETEDDTRIVGLESAFEALCHGELSEFRLECLHGGAPSEIQEATLGNFQSGKTQVLVATSVVEIGIDVPNATLMTIENAEHFGLAQLHQLRGRVSRGVFPGYVGLFATPQTPAAARRIEALVATSDGFELAELDLELRGTGDLFGTRQHGLPGFRVATLPQDQQVLLRAREVAHRLVQQPEFHEGTAYERLREKIGRRYGQVIELGSIG